MDFIQTADPQVLYPAVMLFFLFLLGLALRSKPRRRKGPREMTDHEKFQQRFSDAITTAIEEGLHKGWMNHKQARRMYMKCARKLELPDLWAKSLLPRMLHPFRIALLKKAIKSRISGGAIADIKPIPIPEPPATTNVVPIRPVMRKKKRA